MKRNIVRLGHPALRQQAESVDPGSLETDEMRTLIGDLVETLESK